MVVFTPGWDQPKLTAIPSDTELAALRSGKSATQQKKQGISAKDIEYQKKNNEIREAGKVFLTVFSKEEVLGALCRAHNKFTTDGAATALISAANSDTDSVTLDQGTHQDEDVATGGYMLHFDLRRAGDGLCFHLYVAQNSSGGLVVTEVSYMAGSTKMAVHPSC